MHSHENTKSRSAKNTNKSNTTEDTERTERRSLRRRPATRAGLTVERRSKRKADAFVALRFERRIDGLAPLRGADEAAAASRIFWFCDSAVVQIRALRVFSSV